MHSHRTNRSSRRGGWHRFRILHFFLLLLCLCAFYALRPAPLHTVSKYKVAVGAYTGQMQNGRFQGTGKLVLPDGSILSGHWEKGRLEGEGIFQSKEGWRFSSSFHAGIVWPAQVTTSDRRQWHTDAQGKWAEGSLSLPSSNDGTAAKPSDASHGASAQTGDAS